jgi:hypothetical protein
LVPSYGLPRDAAPTPFWRQNYAPAETDAGTRRDSAPSGRLDDSEAEAPAIIHARQPTPDGGDQGDAHDLTNLGKQDGGFPDGVRLIEYRYTAAREIRHYAPSFSASSGKLATTRSCCG